MNREIHKPELIQRVNANIQSGHFHDTDEMIETALDALDERAPAGAPPARKAFMKSVFIAICSLALFQFSSALGADRFQFVGSWKLNVAKSTNTPGLPAEVIIEQQGDTVVVTLKNDAGVTLRKYSYPLKGGPMTNLEGYRPPNVSESKTVVSDRVMDETVIRDGKPVGDGRYMVEESGKVLTYRRKGTDTQGKPYESTAVYERQ